MYTTKVLPMFAGNMSVNDLTVVFTAAICLFSLRKVLSKFIFKPFGVHEGLKPNSTELIRFVENSWFTLYYVVFAVWGILLTTQASWINDITHVHDNWPEDHYLDFERQPSLHIFYLVSLGFYTQAILTLIFLDERMKDFKEMTIHHICTIMLMLLSLVVLGHRCGQVILTLHDIVDVFLYSAKALHAINKQVLTNIFFALFALTYLVLRLMLLPYIMYITYKSPLHKGTSWLDLDYTLYWLNWSFLPPLLCLHIYWYSLVIKLMIKTFGLGGNVPGDPRHHKVSPKKAT
jgi:hypothetical protein